ncbi:MAG TPA: hypothetical protein VIL88_14755 [Devosia sp.]|jgi:hypothetical protein|uniref:hypothetical protein n=1 Tax=Devosia sp. TaxID=1871048 RepID=UPI002F933F76
MTNHEPTAPERPLWYTERQLRSKAPHVIVQGTFKVADYFGGESIEIDMALSLRAFNKLRDRG